MLPLHRLNGEGDKSECNVKMPELKAYKFRLKTNKKIRDLFSRFAGHCRFVWNQFWYLNWHRLFNGLPIMSYNEMSFWLTRWKKSEERGWLREAHSQVLQQKLMDLYRAYLDGFDKNQPGKWKPRAKKKHWRNSFRFPQGFAFDNRRVWLPKIGWVSFYKSQSIVGKPKSITIYKEAGHWYMSVLVEFEPEICKHPPASFVGLDFGIAKFITTSDGIVYMPLNAYRKYEKRLAKLQRELARKKKFSKNWHKLVEKIRRIHRKIANSRNDYVHKITDELSKNHAYICIEGLYVSNMSASAKGTLEQPGKNVKAKSGLNKSIQDQGWGETRRQLEYKTQWRNGTLVVVDPRYTSQICSSCGHRDKNNRISQSKFLCLSCGFSLNADVNAAKNILKRGLELTAAGQAVAVCGEISLENSVKQKPVRNRKKVSFQLSCNWESPSLREGDLRPFLPLKFSL